MTLRKVSAASVVRLISTYRRSDADKILFSLLKERKPIVNISHKKMPTWKAHASFVRSKPYKAWYLILAGETPVGSIYLSKFDEIGLFVFKRYQGFGFGRKALREVMRLHKGVKRFLANVSPHNKRSIDFFCENSFRHIQNTYEYFRR
jgi:RimJ/RimL family protein N-acetyltransferase